MTKTLTSGQRYLLSNPSLLKEMSPQERGAFYRDVRGKAIAELSDLAFLAKELPERQQARVFSQKNLDPLMDSMLSVKDQFGTEDFEKKRTRLLQIFKALFSKYVCNTTYVLSLAKMERQVLTASQSSSMEMQALYLASTRE